MGSTSQAERDYGFRNEAPHRYQLHTKLRIICMQSGFAPFQSWDTCKGTLRILAEGTLHTIHFVKALCAESFACGEYMQAGHQRPEAQSTNKLWNTHSREYDPWVHSMPGDHDALSH